jgi:hypothetical protein
MNLSFYHDTLNFTQHSAAISGNSETDDSKFFEKFLSLSLFNIESVPISIYIGIRGGINVGIYRTIPR